MWKLFKNEKKAVGWIIGIYMAVFFIPVIALLGRYGFVDAAMFLIYLFFIFLRVTAVMIILLWGLEKTMFLIYGKWPFKTVVIIGELIRSSFMTFMILLHILLIILEWFTYWRVESTELTQNLFVTIFLLSFGGAIFFYYIYERLNLRQASFIYEKKAGELQNKLFPNKQKRIDEIPDLRQYSIYRKELASIYDVLGILVTAGLLFASTYTLLAPETYSIEEDNFPYSILLFMVVYTQAAYYRLPLSFLSKINEN